MTELKAYTFEFKKRLKEQIEKINDRKNLEKIKDIIFKYNPDINVSQNSSGMLLFFHNLNNETYQKLDIFIKKLDTDKIKQLTETYTDEAIKFDKNNIISTNIRLSSVEKNLIKKKDYYNKLNEENNVDSDVVYMNDDIFLDKDILTDKEINNSKQTKVTNTSNKKGGKKK